MIQKYVTKIKMQIRCTETKLQKENSFIFLKIQGLSFHVKLGFSLTTFNNILSSNSYDISLFEFRVLQVLDSDVLKHINSINIRIISYIQIKI